MLIARKMGFVLNIKIADCLVFIGILITGSCYANQARFCDDGWLQLSPHDEKLLSPRMSCIAVKGSHGPSVTWEQAAIGCRSDGGYLVTIDSADMNSYLSQVSSAHETCWTGLRAMFANLRDTYWRWHYNSESWDPGSFSGFRSLLDPPLGPIIPKIKKNQCVHLVTATEAWTASKCDAGLSCYLCMKEASIVTSTTTVSPVIPTTQPGTSPDLPTSITTATSTATVSTPSVTHSSGAGTAQTSTPNNSMSSTNDYSSGSPWTNTTTQSTTGTGESVSTTSVTRSSGAGTAQTSTPNNSMSSTNDYSSGSPWTNATTQSTTGTGEYSTTFSSNSSGGASQPTSVTTEWEITLPVSSASTNSSTSVTTVVSTTRTSSTSEAIGATTDVTTGTVEQVMGAACPEGEHCNRAEENSGTITKVLVGGIAGIVLCFAVATMCVARRSYCMCKDFPLPLNEAAISVEMYDADDPSDFKHSEGPDNQDSEGGTQIKNEVLKSTLARHTALGSTKSVESRTPADMKPKYNSDNAKKLETDQSSHDAGDLIAQKANSVMADNSGKPYCQDSSNEIQKTIHQVLGVQGNTGSTVKISDLTGRHENRLFDAEVQSTLQLAEMGH